MVVAELRLGLKVDSLPTQYSRRRDVGAIADTVYKAGLNNDVSVSQVSPVGCAQVVIYD